MTVDNIDIEKCIGCGECVLSCPMDVFRLDTLVQGKQESSPCSLACPLGVKQREYHDLIKLDMLDKAAEILRLDHPMPAITGRLCPHPCETECSRNEVDEAININGLEQYLGDHILSLEPVDPVRLYKDKVAVIGSGPAGLATAYHLTLSGYEVTVFEKNDKPGGLLRSAVPAFRLPEDVLDSQIGFYEKMGITFKTGVMFGKDTTREKLENKGYRAFVAAIGAARPLGLSVPGSDAKGITSSMDFLKGVKSNRLERLDPGLKDSMLALSEEIDDAMAEGINIYPSRGIDSFGTRGGQVSSIRCVECLSVRDEDGRFNPIYGNCVLPREIEAETVILAIGQTADPDLAPDGFAVDQQGFILADDMTRQVAPGLFAVGDAVSGPSTVVEALASGKRAALTIDRFLKHEDISSGLDKLPPRAEGPPREKIPQVDRIDRQTLPPEDRKTSFQDTVLSLSWNEARMESTRCLTCGSRPVITHVDDCQTCWLCHAYCPVEAITISPVKYVRPMVGWG